MKIFVLLLWFFKRISKIKEITHVAGKINPRIFHWPCFSSLIAFRLTCELCCSQDERIFQIVKSKPPFFHTVWGHFYDLNYTFFAAGIGISSFMTCFDSAMKHLKNCNWGKNLIATRCSIDIAISIYFDRTVRWHRVYWNISPLNSDTVPKALNPPLSPIIQKMKPEDWMERWKENFPCENRLLRQYEKDWELNGKNEFFLTSTENTFFRILE